MRHSEDLREFIAQWHNKLLSPGLDPFILNQQFEDNVLFRDLKYHLQEPVDPKHNPLELWDSYCNDFHSNNLKNQGICQKVNNVIQQKSNLKFSPYLDDLNSHSNYIEPFIYQALIDYVTQSEDKKDWIDRYLQRFNFEPQRSSSAVCDVEFRYWQGAFGFTRCDGKRYNNDISEFKGKMDDLLKSSLCECITNYSGEMKDIIDRTRELEKQRKWLLKVLDAYRHILIFNENCPLLAGLLQIDSIKD
jgi:hypothetical protein